MIAVTLLNMGDFSMDVEYQSVPAGMTPQEFMDDTFNPAYVREAKAITFPNGSVRYTWFVGGQWRFQTTIA